MSIGKSTRGEVLRDCYLLGLQASGEFVFISFPFFLSFSLASHLILFLHLHSAEFQCAEVRGTG